MVLVALKKKSGSCIILVPLISLPFVDCGLNFQCCARSVVCMDASFTKGKGLLSCQSSNHTVCIHNESLKTEYAIARKENKPFLCSLQTTRVYAYVTKCVFIVSGQHCSIIRPSSEN